MTLSPLFEIDNESRANHPNIRSDAMFPPKRSPRWLTWLRPPPKRNVVDGKAEEIFEPLDHIEPGLPRTLIHVSGSEVLLNDARKAATCWPPPVCPWRSGSGRVRCTSSRSPRPPLKEATRSLRQVGDYIREATW